MAEEIEAEERLRIPVIESFDKSNQVIGWLDIPARIVPDFPNFHFGLGFRAKINPVKSKDDWEWVAVAIVSDDKFRAFTQDEEGVHL